MNPPAKYLVVEDEALVARSLARYFSRLGDAHTAGTVAAARALLAADRSWTGIVIDVGLPDGTGLELLEWVRAAGFDTPVLVLTGQREDDVVRAAALHGAMYLPKPFDREHLAAFVKFSQRATDGSAVLQRVVATVGQSSRLSAREREILLLAAAGLARDAIAHELSISTHTLNTYIRRVLVKTGAESWQDLIQQVHAQVFSMARADAPIVH